jgi:glycosyltransferase involved in cell wall biosynthesis
MTTQHPKISVILPAYNCADYLQEAVQSILNQTFVNFELIIINDGSTDDTENIIRSFSDERIVYVKNETNQGLVYTLNRGIDLARGKYIARMDGDDICKMQRFEKQITFFLKYPEAKVLATTVDLINERNENLKPWAEDIKHTTPKEIYNFLPVNNCIAHPSVMIDTAILKKYRYNPKQKLSEDYDLWLRLSADNIEIYKLNDSLLFHRILKQSFTRTTGKNIFLKIMKVKFQFIRHQVKKGKTSLFLCKTFFYATIDFMKGIAWGIKHKAL